MTPEPKPAEAVQRFDPIAAYIGTGEYVGDMEASPDGDYVLHSDYESLASELKRAMEERDEARQTMICGHPLSLLVKSAETGLGLYCELCDDKSGRRDAEEMEAHYRARAETAERALSELGELLAVIHRDGGHRQQEIGTSAAIKEAIGKVIEARSEIEGVRRDADPCSGAERAVLFIGWTRKGSEIA